VKILRIYKDLSQWLKPNKVLVLYGARQVGKTTLLRDFLLSCQLNYRLDSGDNIRTQTLLSSSDFEKIKDYAAGYDLIAIDEAQKIANIGQALKIMVDQIPGIKVIATGSASFELMGQIGEPLTGRKTTLTLYPISQLELGSLYNSSEIKEKLEQWLIFGSYPEVVTASDRTQKAQLLEELVHSYLLKDILELERVRSSKILLDLLRLLAFQTGSEVSLSELAQHLAIDYKTVAKYLDLFEKSFIIYNLRGFSRNLRNEITNKSKYYFYDTGIRNAVISNFNEIALRNDMGQLWENFVFIERLKKQGYHNIFSNNYFWRTWTQKEIDLVEEREGSLFAYEFKWNKRKVTAPKEWKEAYPESHYEIISKENYLSFVA
jgi:predicted AAA+ superfamily ATPase